MHSRAGARWRCGGRGGERGAKWGEMVDLGGQWGLRWGPVGMAESVEAPAAAAQNHPQAGQSERGSRCSSAGTSASSIRRVGWHCRRRSDRGSNPLLPRHGQGRLHRRVHPGGIRTDGDRDHGEGEAGRDRPRRAAGPRRQHLRHAVDAQGRISIDRALRDFAGLELNTRVVVAGSFDRVEIWNAADLRRRRPPEAVRSSKAPEDACPATST